MSRYWWRQLRQPLMSRDTRSALWRHLAHAHRPDEPLPLAVLLVLSGAVS